MVFDSKTTTKTSFPDGKVYYEGFALALKAQGQFYAAARREQSGKYKSLIASIANTINTNLESALIDALGGGKIQETPGGFVPDYFIKLDNGVTELRELKLSSTQETPAGPKRTGYVKIGGGEGLQLKPGKSELISEIDVRPEGVSFTKEEVQTTRLFNDLYANRNDSAAIGRILNRKSPAATAIRATLIAKANIIQIPVVVNGNTEVRSIKFTWSDLLNASTRKTGRFTVKPKKIDDKVASLSINFVFFGSTITKALRAAQATAQKITDGPLIRELQAVIINDIKKYGPSAYDDIASILKELGFKSALKYIKGSVKISSGIVQFNFNERKNKQKFISSVQWTALVQKRLGETMEKFGPPDAPDLKERSGRFRQSVQVSADYRKNLLRYTYMPLYYSLTAYGYAPDRQVTTAIREVAQSLYTRKFNITRM